MHLDTPSGTRTRARRHPWRTWFDRTAHPQTLHTRPRTLNLLDYVRSRNRPLIVHWSSSRTRISEFVFKNLSFDNQSMTKILPHRTPCAYSDQSPRSLSTCSSFATSLLRLTWRHRTSQSCWWPSSSSLASSSQHWRASVASSARPRPWSRRARRAGNDKSHPLWDARA